MSSKEAQPTPLETLYGIQVKKLRQDTSFSSNPNDQIDHPAMRNIIELGPGVASLIIQDFKKGKVDIGLFHALREITGENPVVDKDRGNVRKMAESWREWYDQKHEQVRLDR